MAETKNPVNANIFEAEIQLENMRKQLDTLVALGVKNDALELTYKHLSTQIRILKLQSLG